MRFLELLEARGGINMSSSVKNAMGYDLAADFGMAGDIADDFKSAGDYLAEILDLKHLK